jgi:DNA invertase Pin-like site-specific DNA recombinase
MIQETIIGDMLKNGYALISSCEPDLCSSDPSRVLIRQIFGALAQYDRAMITLKLRSARERIRAREGKCEGRRAFGYHEKEKPLLARMIQLKSEGLNPEQISIILNNDGILTRYRKIWYPATVAKILKRN